jgi:MYXO-CTERM domain-containing protein
VTANNTATDETSVSVPPLPAAGTRVSSAAAPGGTAMLLLGGLLLVFGRRLRRHGRIA